MSTPRQPSPQGMNVARDMRRSFLGGKNGRTGLSPVTRGAQPEGVRAQTIGGLDDYGFYRVDGGAYVGTVLNMGLNEIAPKAETNTLTDSGSATYNPANGMFQVQRAGLWVLMAYIRVDTMPTGYLYLQTGRAGFAEAGPNQPFIDNGSDIEAAGVTAPGVAFVGSFLGAQVLLGVGGPVVESAYVVLYPIAFFD